MARVIVRHSDAAHPGQARGDNAFLGVLQDDASLRLDTEVACRLEKNIRRGLDVRDIETADDDLKKMPDAETRQNSIDGIAIR